MAIEASAGLDQRNIDRAPPRPSSEASPGFPGMIRRIVDRILPFMLGPNEENSKIGISEELLPEPSNNNEKPGFLGKRLVGLRGKASDNRKNNNKGNESQQEKNQLPYEDASESDIEITGSFYPEEADASSPGFANKIAPLREHHSLEKSRTPAQHADISSPYMLPRSFNEQRIPRKRKRFKAFERNTKHVIINPSSESDDEGADSDIQTLLLAVTGKPTVKKTANSILNSSNCSPKNDTSGKLTHAKPSVPKPYLPVPSSEADERSSGESDFDSSMAEYVVLGSSLFRACEADLINEHREAANEQFELCQKDWVMDTRDPDEVLKELRAFMRREKHVSVRGQQDAPALETFPSPTQQVDHINQEVAVRSDVAVRKSSEEETAQTSPKTSFQRPKDENEDNDACPKVFEDEPCQDASNAFPAHEKTTSPKETEIPNLHSSSSILRTSTPPEEIQHEAPSKVEGATTEQVSQVKDNLSSEAPAPDDNSKRQSKRGLRNKKRKSGSERKMWRQQKKTRVTKPNDSDANLEEPGEVEVPDGKQSLSIPSSQALAPVQDPLSPLASKTSRKLLAATQGQNETESCLDGTHIKKAYSPIMFCGSSSNVLNQALREYGEGSEFSVTDNIKTSFGDNLLQGAHTISDTTLLGPSQSTSTQSNPQKLLPSIASVDHDCLKSSLRLFHGHSENPEVISISLGSSRRESIISIDSLEESGNSLVLRLKHLASLSQLLHDITIHDTVIPNSSQSVQASQQRNPMTSQIAVNSSQDVDSDNTISSLVEQLSQIRALSLSKNCEELALNNKSFAEIIREKFIEAGNNFSGFGIDSDYSGLIS
ncbi:hypothetical protein METBIDRAFT_121629 [Metschnikowia bicuspidata var. bicuspidata NRRL YB-4993]|uniref:Uncharacterized protein n=1 Tax=Metschnikowia bicuspidata var. bicuspidata NRRL YB-4993 TaxID=869754 RepID=A0A1A0HJU1_9ASCO|nr:hypothetical protein METBIDRAFT_121629 [Metschnikowia bicuspidata var. bicuspidata NRRL YB-4993]OBA24266.1 hypothetical protein METBIDRAFT_121629 [Metschnikowia bicuspidata var. bicuspidata NRRL YB-4993]